ncbi:lysyl endopeptidase, partial [Salinibacter ruber]|uniref:fibronectin type III domain-containing protein n=1 Tax=Salinibacter ruber TaxID=146919 RepID=UPI0021676234
MPDITFEIYLCALLIGLVGGLQAAGAQRSPKLPSQRYPSVQSSESVPVKHLPDVKANARRATEERQEGEIAPYRYGRVLQTTITPQSHGTWERLPNGSWLWRLRLHSEDAISLSLGFSEFALPNGARLYVHGEDKGLLHGPYTDADVTDGKHRTPLVQGDDIVVELTVPEGRRSALALTLGTVVHGSRPLRPARRSKSGTCNVDVACNEGDPWRNQVRSVGLYSFEKDNSAYVCTGTLVNNTARNGRPFFLTAEHCVSSPEVASTMVFYWNYQNATCRVQGSDRNGQVTADDRLAQTSSGAVLRARLGSTHERGEIHGKPDLALVEVDDVIPLEYGLFFSGWTRSRTPSKVGATVHHPAGHGKRISFDRDATSVTAFGGETGEGSTHLRIGEWDLGTTEAGSSGAPLYNDQQRIVGVLSGGLAGCRRGAAEDNDKPDWYGRIALGFTSGDYTPEGFQRPATLADWLDPTDSGAKALGGYSQVGRGAPEVPSGLKASTTVDRVVLDWASSRSDDVVGYRVYRGVTPVDSTLVAQSIHTFFGQTRAGTTSFVDTTIAPDTKYHYRVTAVDSTRRASSFSAGVQVSPGKQLVTYHIEVASGWNMVSTPVRPSAKGFASALPSGCESPYRWRPAQGAYQELGSGKTLAPGGGAWTFCQSGGTAEVTGTPVSSSDKATEVEAGWNQVGPFEADIAPGEVRQDPSGILQAGTWFRWDPGQGQYTEPQVLEPGEGYWVFATGSGTLDFSGGGSKQATAAAVRAQSKGSASAGEAPEGALTLQVTDRAGHSREVYLARQ